MRKLEWIGLLALLVLGLTAPVAAAAEGQLPLGFGGMEVLNKAGQPEARAGVHPDLFAAQMGSVEGGGNRETPRDIVIEFPPGMGGDTSSVPACPREIFDGASPLIRGCSPVSQVGTFEIKRLQNGDEALPVYGEAFPIFSLEPAPDEVAAFGVRLFGAFHLKLSGQLRPSDSRLVLRVGGLPEESLAVSDPAVGTRFVFWGIPADHQVGTSIPRRPLLTMPTRCNGPLAVDLHIRNWAHLDEWLRGSLDTGIPLQGCENLPFAAKVGFALDSASADSPSGATLSLELPQGSGDPDGVVSSQAKSAKVELPVGMALSPGVADRLSACSDAQLGQGEEGEAKCPPSSKVGTVEISAPQLREPLSGKIYLGSERPGERFRLFVAASGSGAEMKFISSLRPDPTSGRIAAIFNDLPQVSFSQMKMSFDGGPRALLITPTSCGEASANATLLPYSGGAAATASASVAIAAKPGSACGSAMPFAPTLAAAVSDPRGGRSTAFSTTISRRDGEQLPERLQIQFPLGLGASLGSVDPCPDGAAAAGSCAASSRVGSAVAELGPGSEAARIDGSVYLTGPYRRAPFGLAIAFKAKLGPFDLGTMVVRGGLDADPETGQITVRMDALPLSFEGLPVRFQTLGLEIDRPGFMRNPTSCSQSSIEALMTSSTGAKAHPSARFRVRGCIGLPFKPHFSLALSDRGELHPGGRPGLELSGRVPAANANLRDVEIAMPRIIKFDSSELGAICARPDASAGRCPKASRIGTASARTPLLKAPLRGSLFAVQPKGDATPDVWIELAGSGLQIRLRGETSSKGGRVQTKLVDLPDFTLSSFQMRFSSGEHGVIKLRSAPCRATPKALLAPIAVEAQNRALVQLQARAAAPCGGRAASPTS